MELLGLTPSSSSLQTCVSAVGCAEMSADACIAFGGTIVESCPVSSSSVPPSSSSVSIVPSSSSVAPSSSSIAPSSSSVAYSGKGNNISSYRTVRIGDQTWMAENLDYVVEGSKCHSNNPANCATYGSLYNWATAMDLPSSCTSNTCSSMVQTKHKGICPSGWHIPSHSEWTTLTDYVGGASTAGRKLKATSGWYNCGPSGSGSSYLCEDTYGFSALPGGNGFWDGRFDYVGDYGFWWSATEGNAGYAYLRDMRYYDDGVYYNFSHDKSFLFSVRCLQD